jgi:hypothetical protein
MDKVTNSDSQAPNRPRIRFGLRALFVLMTAVCVWLGYRVILERRANEIAARHDAVLAAISKPLPSQQVPTMDSIPLAAKTNCSLGLNRLARNFDEPRCFESNTLR